MKRHLQCVEQEISNTNVTQYPAWRAKIDVMIDPCYAWNVIYKKRSNRCQPPKSPNAALVRKRNSHITRYLESAEQQVSPSNLTKYCACQQKYSHAWSSSHIQRDLHCAEQQVFTVQVTKCCAFHAKGLACTKQQVLPSTSPKTAPATKHNAPKFGRKFPKTGETSFTIRGQSEHDPRMKSSVRNPPRNQGYFSRPPRVFSWKIQHLVAGLWFKAAPATPTAPNTAPATERLWHWTISITGRFYYSVMTNLLRNESITWQFYSLLCDVVRISEVSYLNFLWLFIIVYCLLYLTKTIIGFIVLLLSTLITCKMYIIDLDILYHTCSIVVCAHKNGVSTWRPNKPNYVVKIIWCFAIQLYFLYIVLSNPLAFSFSFASSNLDGI